MAPAALLSASTEVLRYFVMRTWLTMVRDICILLTLLSRSSFDRLRQLRHLVLRVPKRMASWPK